MTEQTPEQFTNPDAFAKILAEAQGEAPDPPADQGTLSDVAEEITGEEAEAAPSETEGEEGAAKAEDEEPAGPVPLSRFKKENEKRRAAEEKAAALQQQIEALNSIVSKELKGEQPKEEVSLGDLDPLDPDTTKALVARIDQLEAQLAETRQSATATNVQVVAQRQKAEFEKANPDFQAAIDHLGKVEVAKYEALLGPEDAAKAATASIGQIVAACHKQGKNVPETLYKMAKAAGYQVKKDAPKVDLARLEQNKKSTATVATIPSASAAPNPIGVYATKEGFKEHLLDGKRRVDPDKFQKVLKKIHDNADRVAV